MKKHKQAKVDIGLPPELKLHDSEIRGDLESQDNA